LHAQVLQSQQTKAIFQLKRQQRNGATYKRFKKKIAHLLDCNVGLWIGYDCSQALTPREVRAGKKNEPYRIKTDLGCSVMGGSDVPNEKHLCHRFAVKELPAVSI